MRPAPFRLRAATTARVDPPYAVAEKDRKLYSGQIVLPTGETILTEHGDIWHECWVDGKLFWLEDLETFGAKKNRPEEIT